MDILTAIIGASDSIWIRASNALLRESGLVDSELSSVDSRLDLRCLLEQPGFDSTDALPREQDLDPFPELDVFPIDQPLPDDSITSSYDWQYRWLAGDPKEIQIIVDSEREFRFRIENSRSSLVQDKPFTKKDLKTFKAAWETAIPVGELYEAPEAPQDNELWEVTRQSLIVVQKEWKTVLDQLCRDPTELHRMNPREFEALVAELLARDGFMVKLTPYSKDGGIDVIASRTGLINELYLIQCKRNSTKRPVGIEVVRSLYGVVHQQEATAGLIVTTSRLTRDAKAHCKKIEHQMSFREYDDLVKWVIRTKNR